MTVHLLKLLDGLRTSLERGANSEARVLLGSARPEALQGVLCQDFETGLRTSSVRTVQNLIKADALFCLNFLTISQE